MGVGIVTLADQRWSVAVQWWQRVKAYGFAHGWTYDHIGWRDLVDGPWFDAVPTLAAASLATSRIRLGTMVASPNFRHPVHFAREVTALDDLCGGRTVVGVGARCRKVRQPCARADASQPAEAGRAAQRVRVSP